MAIVSFHGRAITGAPRGLKRRSAFSSLKCLYSFGFFFAFLLAVISIYNLSTVTSTPYSIPLERGLPLKEYNESNLIKRIESRFFCCANQGSCIIGRKCNADYDITKLLEYLPEEQNLPTVDRKLMNHLDLSFLLWFCSLPATNESSMSSEKCTFDKEGAFDNRLDNFFCDVTVTKSIKMWIHTMIRHSYGLDTVKGQSERFVYLKSYMNTFHWRPSSKQICPGKADQNVNSWFIQDSCPIHIASKSSLHPETALLWKRIGEFSRKHPSASSSILIQGVFLRHVLSRHLGVCLRKLVNKTVTQMKEIVPRSKDGYVSFFCPDSRPAISMHIRRGDSCERWCESKCRLRDSSSSRRPCFETKLYTDSAIAMKKRYGACRILLSTDDHNVISDFQLFANRHNFTIQYLKFNRSIFSPPEKGPKGFIENRNMSQDQKNLITASIVADLLFLSKGDFLIGSGSSLPTRLALLSIAAHTGRIPPFVTLDEPFDVFKVSRGTRYPNKCGLNSW